MKNSRVIWVSLLVSAVLGVLLYAWPRSGVSEVQGTGQSTVDLFSGNAAQDGEEFSERDISKQHKFVEVQASAMEALASGADRVRLQLLDGQEYTVVFKDRENSPVAVVATGELEGVPGSQVILSTASGEDGSRKVSGKFTLPDGKVLQLTPTLKGHCLFELDLDSIDIVCEPLDGNGQVGTYKANGETIQLVQQQVGRRFLRGNNLFRQGSNSNGGGSSGGGSSGGGSSGGGSSGGTATIDIIVMYTVPAAKAKGGDAGIKSHIGSAVADVNKAFQNSKINAKVRLVGTGKMNYDSKGDLSAALSKLKSDPAAKALRNSKKADLVSVIMAGNSGGAAGLGALMPSAKGNAAACYSAVHEKYAIGYHSFAHELGHNLGSHHCWDQSGTGVFKYAHGHRWKGTDGKGYRSIMSYGKNGDLRMGYFSNPKVSFKGKPTGDATKADNGKTFGVTAPVVSKYK